MSFKARGYRENSVFECTKSTQSSRLSLLLSPVQRREGRLRWSAKSKEISLGKIQIRVSFGDLESKGISHPL